MSKSTELNENQLVAVQLVASGKQGKLIAETLLVTEETVSRWRQLPAFEAAVNTLLRDAREAARERLRALVSTALDTIEGAMVSAELSAKDKLSAAFKVLEMCNIKDQASANIGPCDPDAVHKKNMSLIMMESLTMGF